MKINKLYNEDCLEGMKRIPDGFIDCVITDPPYGITACSWDTVIPFEPMWEQLKRITKPNGAIVLFGSEPFSSKLRMSNLKDYRYDWIWDKRNISNPFMAKVQPLRQHEVIMIFYSKAPVYNPQPYRKSTVGKIGRLSAHRSEHFGSTKVTAGSNDSIEGYPRSIISCIPVMNNLGADKRGAYHPTQKPVKLMEYLVKTYTNKGDLVLDFAIGSGTTAVACKQNRRNYVGFELDPKYHKIACERIKHVARGLF